SKTNCSRRKDPLNSFIPKLPCISIIKIKLLLGVYLLNNKHTKATIYIIAATLFCLLYSAKYHGPVFITDKLGLTSIKAAHLVTPNTIEELQTIVRNAHQPISIIGGRYSQGGQIAYPHGIAIDMKGLNNIISLDVKNKTITVQAGATWHRIQQYIDP